MNAAQIAQELETLEAKNRACAEQLRVLYQRYLTELSHSASQQLTTVCYHLCTQSYPEAFLGLPPQEREALQTRVRSQAERLRQQLSLEGLLLPEPGDVEETNQPRVAVIKAELTGDDLEMLTSALDEDNSDRILSFLKDKDIELPFDLEAVMKQRQQLAAEKDGAGEADSPTESEPVAPAAPESPNSRSADSDSPDSHSQDSHSPDSHNIDGDNVNSRNLASDSEASKEDSAEVPVFSSDRPHLSPGPPLAPATGGDAAEHPEAEQTEADAEATSAPAAKASAETESIKVNSAAADAPAASHPESSDDADATRGDSAAHDASGPAALQFEGYSSAAASRAEQAAPETGRSLGRRFLEDILSGRALERRRSSQSAAKMSGEGSLRIESDAASESAAEAPEQPAQATAETATTAAQAEARQGAEAAKAERANVEASAEAEPVVQAEEHPETAEPDAFADNNGFDPNFEPPPAEDRYEPMPLRANDKLDISPGVLASALVAEGEDDQGRMLMRPNPYDGSTELSEEALRDPFALIRWVERMERGISQRLRQSSQRMTRSLEKSRILNNELPDGLLEAAVRPDGDHEDDSDRSMPHVLSLRLNAAGKDNRPRKDKSIRIVAIYLRLSEIEFTTPGVMAWRNQLRNQVKQLRRLSNQYKACKHAQNVVDAQALWRDGWEQK